MKDEKISRAKAHATKLARDFNYQLVERRRCGGCLHFSPGAYGEEPDTCMIQNPVGHRGVGEVHPWGICNHHEPRTK